MSRTYEELKAAIEGHSPLIYIQTPEEERLLRVLSVLSKELGWPMRKWSSVRGLEGVDASLEPVKALLSVIDLNLSGMSIFCVINWIIC